MESLTGKDCICKWAAPQFTLICDDFGKGKYVEERDKNFDSWLKMEAVTTRNRLGGTTPSHDQVSGGS